MSRTCRTGAVAAIAALMILYGAACLAQATPAPAAVGPAPLPAMVQWYTTQSGVKYAEISLGHGPVPKDGQIVIMHYTGWLDDGKQFESSRGGKPFGFPLGSGQVIRGWDEGVRGMKVGGTRRLIIPASAAYQDRGVPGKVPPNATLTFDIELLHVTDKK